MQTDGLYYLGFVKSGIPANRSYSTSRFKDAGFEHMASTLPDSRWNTCQHEPPCCPGVLRSSPSNASEADTMHRKDDSCILYPFIKILVLMTLGPKFVERLSSSSGSKLCGRSQSYAGAR